VKTTIPFHQKVMDDRDFAVGNIDTHFLERFEKTRS
jgi:biotin carboxylase